MDNYAHYQISYKGIIKKGNEILILQTSDGYLDFPGGRVNKDEVELPSEEILSREIEEELGENLKYKINNIALISRRKFNLENNVKNVLAIFYELDYLGGDLFLSDEHEKFSWVKPEKIVDMKFVSEDEKEKLLKYFDLD